MNRRGRPTVAITALVMFTGLAITMLVLGQPATAVGTLIPAIVLGVQQMIQAFDAIDSTPRRAPDPRPSESHDSVIELETSDRKEEGERPAA